jgi:hypothetical protein
MNITRLVIIREDGFMSINDRGLVIDLSDMPADLHAVQWSGGTGHIERAGLMNQPIESLGDFVTWIERWIARAAELDAPVVVTLEDAKTAKNAEINAARADANSRTFHHDGREFACDALSRSDIDGINGYVALNGGFPEQFPGAWKAVDNSYYPLPGIASWKAFYAAMVATGAANFAHAQNLKAQLASATTVEEVEAIAW